jgi:CheY-like chemotaxis protein
MSLTFDHASRGGAGTDSIASDDASSESLSLRGLRALVVEDSYLAARSIKRALEHLGCEVIGPAPSVRDAMPLIETKPIDVAVLDINLSEGQTSEDLAIALTDRRVPFVFVSGYASPIHLSARFHTTPRVRKPIIESNLLTALRGEIRRLEG